MISVIVKTEEVQDLQVMVAIVVVDEGKLIYSGETAGAITVTIPSDSGDQVQILGHMFDENVIRFRPTLVLIEV